MKNNITIFGCLFAFVFLGSHNVAFSQSENEAHATIEVYRVQESMMSGGRGLEVKLFLDDIEISSILTGTKLKYEMLSLGEHKLKFIAEFGGGAIGSPFVKTMKFENGKEYHISVSAASMTGVKCEFLDEKGIKKMAKETFADESVIVEGK